MIVKYNCDRLSHATREYEIILDFLQSDNDNVVFEYESVELATRRANTLYTSFGRNGICVKVRRRANCVIITRKHLSSEPFKPHAEREKVKKIKATSADIMVKGNYNNPFYVLICRRAGADLVSSEFGSYCLDDVVEWRDKFIDIV